MNYTIQFPENYVKPPLPGRDEWIAALRSGKYSQCSDQLCNGTGHCCLGVLSKIQGRLTLRGKYWIDGDLEGSLDDSNPLFSVLQDGHGSGNGRFPLSVYVDVDESDRTCLAECNDAGLTFDQISEIIEAVWENAPKNW